MARIAAARAAIVEIDGNPAGQGRQVDSVDTVTAVKGGSGAIDQVVVAVTSAQRVGATATDQQVIAVAADKDIVAAQPLDRDIVGTGAEGVGNAQRQTGKVQIAVNAVDIQAVPVGGDIDRQTGADNGKTGGVGEIVDRHADLGVGARDADAIKRNRAHRLERYIDAAELDAVFGCGTGVLYRDIGEGDVAIVLIERDGTFARTARFGRRIAGKDNGIEADRRHAGGVAHVQTVVLAACHRAVGKTDAVIDGSRVHQDDLVGRTGKVNVLDVQRLACAAAANGERDAAGATVDDDVADTLQGDPLGYREVLDIGAFVHFHGVARIGRGNARTDGRERADQVVAGIEHQHIGRQVEIDAAAVEVDAFNAVQRIRFAGAGIAELPGTIGIAGDRVVVLVAVDDDRVALAGDRVHIVRNARVRAVAIDGIVSAIDEEGIVAGSTDHGVTACAAGNPIIAGAAIQKVVAAIAGEHVVVASAMKLIVSDAAAQRVVAVIAVRHDADIRCRTSAGHGRCVDDIIARPALDLDRRDRNTRCCEITGDVERAAASGEVDFHFFNVLDRHRVRTGRGGKAGRARNRVQGDGLARCRRRQLQRVFVSTAIDRVGPVADIPDDGVVSFIAVDRVVAAQTGQPVIAGATADDVRAAGAGKRVIAAAADDGHRASRRGIGVRVGIRIAADIEHDVRRHGREVELVDDVRERVVLECRQFRTVDDRVDLDRIDHPEEGVVAHGPRRVVRRIAGIEHRKMNGAVAVVEIIAGNHKVRQARGIRLDRKAPIDAIMTGSRTAKGVVQDRNSAGGGCIHLDADAALRAVGVIDDAVFERDIGAAFNRQRRLT